MIGGYVVLPGTPRPQAASIAMMHLGGYAELVANSVGQVTGTVEHRLEIVAHEPCGWQHPTWHDEVEERLERHLKSCELRDEDDEWKEPLNVTR